MSTPYRKCDFCTATDYPFTRNRRFERRAWTWHVTSAKLSCPNCRQKGRTVESAALYAKLAATNANANAGL